VAGAVEWYQHRLQSPDSVQAATAALFAHNDFLNEFINEMCVVGADAMVPIKDMWDAYKQWCEEQGEDPAQGRTFNHMMEKGGFERRQARIHGRSGKAWTGIGLTEHEECMGELPEEADRHQKSQEAEEHWRRPVKQFPLQRQFKSVFNGGVRVG
jgi:phage/plasmid-associated DNA primase